MNIVSPYPLWYFFLCILVGVLVAFVLYRKDKKLDEFAQWLVAALAIFRILSVSIICALLLSPLVKYFSKTVEKPIFIIATDNSSSMRVNTDSLNTLILSIEQLREKLSEEFEVASFLFDENTREQDSTPLFDGKISNYQSLFSALDDRFVNRNVGGLILISDGIYNQGTNPIYLTDKLAYPIYTIPTGDTATIRDAKIAQVRNNDIAFLGNDFALEIDLQVKEAKGQKVTVKLRKDNETVYSENLVIDSDDFLTTLKTAIEAKEAGVQKYTVEVVALTEERNTLNNRMSFYIDVLDGRQKIALVSTAPHPDIAAIKRSIEENKNYELSTILLAEFGDVADYDLIILHNSFNVDQTVNGPLKKILESDKPLWLIGNGWDAMGAQFGIRPSTNRDRTQRNETYPLVNENFSLFTISENLTNQLERFPPLNGYASNADNKNVNTTLFYQKIEAVKTQYPLFVFYEKEGRKVGRLFANGLWKWSINDFVENKSHENFGELIGKTIQYLALKSDRSNFRVSTANEYFENEEITFDAQVFNQSYELINEGEVSIAVIDENKKRYEFNFNRSQNAYRLNISSLPPGKYNYQAITSLKGAKHKDGGTFTVKELQLEQIETVAKHNLLFQLAKNSGGEMVYPERMQSISELLNARNDINSISYMNEEVEDIINIRWIFFVIAGLFIVEWFLRKRNGAY